MVASVNNGRQARARGLAGAGAAKSLAPAREHRSASADELAQRGRQLCPIDITTHRARSIHLPPTHAVILRHIRLLPHTSASSTPIASSIPASAHISQDGVGGVYDSVCGATFASWKLHPADSRTGWTTVRAAGTATMCKLAPRPLQTRMLISVQSVAVRSTRGCRQPHLLGQDPVESRVICGPHEHGWQRPRSSHYLDYRYGQDSRWPAPYQDKRVAAFLHWHQHRRGRLPRIIPSS